MNYLLGAICGDGSLAKRDYQLIISLSKNERKYAEHIRNLIKFSFGLNPPITELDRCISIFLRNKVVHTFLTKVVGLPSGKRQNYGMPKIIKQDSELLKEFIAGLFDTDGTTYFKKGRKTPYIRIVQKGKRILNEIKEVFDLFGIKSVLECNKINGYKEGTAVYSLAIYSKTSVLTFGRLIKSRHPYKSNIINSCLHTPL